MGMVTEFSGLGEATKFAQEALLRNWKEARIIKVDRGYRVICKGDESKG